MTCNDFQRVWDELLDADALAEVSPIPVEPGAHPSGEAEEEALLDHAAGCPDCRQLAIRYRVLRQATRAWRRPPLPSTDLVDRILAAPSSAWPVYADVERERPRETLVGILSFAVAAAVIVAISLPTISMMVRRAQDGRPANPPIVASRTLDQDLHAISGSTRAPGDRPGLNRALADATSATWDLARSASEPAARISRDMLNTSTLAGDGSSDVPPEGRQDAGDRAGLETAALTVPVPSLGLFTPDPGAASAALQQVGDHLAAGVRPLSATARHAFGFLIGPASDQAAPRRSPPSSKGA